MTDTAALDAEQARSLTDTAALDAEQARSLTEAAALDAEQARIDLLMAQRPAWRGLLHGWAFALSIPGGLFLILFADRPAARVATAIYVGTLLLAFGTSAAYHRIAQSYRARTVMQRLDHSMIYLLIAGTYAPICLVALPWSWGIPLMSVVGAMAVLGITIKLVAFGKMSWLGYALYPIMGWCALAAAPVIGTHLSTVQLALIFAGGVAYTVGFPVLLLRRPDPWPSVFGYHEVWHSFTVLAAGLHFGAVALLVV